MKYATPGAFRTALEQRLMNMSKQPGGLPLTRLRKGIVFERLLARLVRADGDRWVLKGAVALEFRRKIQTRTTKDLDLGYTRSEEDAVATLRTAMRHDLRDGFVFAVERASEVSEDDPGAVRFLVRAEMAGRTFEEIRVDLAFGDLVIGKPETVKGPGLLEFAGIETPVILAQPLEQQGAEKGHAYTRTYGTGKASTRSKDLVDLVLIGSFAKFDGDRLRKALEEIFSSRATHQLPSALPAPPSDWQAPYRRMASEVGLDDDIKAGHERAARLVDPVLKDNVKGAKWDPSTLAWSRRSKRRKTLLRGKPQR